MNFHTGNYYYYHYSQPWCQPNRVHKLFSRTVLLRTAYPGTAYSRTRVLAVDSFTQTPVQVWRNCRNAETARGIFFPAREHDHGVSCSDLTAGLQDIPTVPFFRKGANMTPRRARERTAWGAHVITYGLFFKSVFWVSCKSADQTKMLQNSCSIRDCTAKKTRSPPLRRTPL